MQRLIYFAILLVTLGVFSLQTEKTNAQTIDFAVEVVSPTEVSINAINATKVEILGPLDVVINAEKWIVLGGCSNSPNLIIDIIGPLEISFDATKVEILSPLDSDLNAKKVCITNPNDLDYETLKLLRLVD